MNPTEDPGALPPASLEGALERVARELLRQQRSERRWRVFFRLAWLGLAIAVCWALFANRMAPSAPPTPHTALVELRGEIAAEGEASAEVLVAALRS
ncbi:MAG: S49 family peptidase, partial [Chitinophagaceae bacterium]|nr:S49 family peptidase [Rubrivivax sp.]